MRKRSHVRCPKCDSNLCYTQDPPQKAPSDIRCDDCGWVPTAAPVDRGPGRNKRPGFGADDVGASAFTSQPAGADCPKCAAPMDARYYKNESVPFAVTCTACKYSSYLERKKHMKSAPSQGLEPPSGS